jgi:hypothetical protein
MMSDLQIVIVSVMTSSAVICGIMIVRQSIKNNEHKKKYGPPTTRPILDRLGVSLVCRCGHPEKRHNGFSGPNSIGRWHYGECSNGAKTVGEYRIGGCGCREFKARRVSLTNKK